jgi:hypothetical protein
MGRCRHGKVNGQSGKTEKAGNAEDGRIRSLWREESHRQAEQRRRFSASSGPFRSPAFE